MYGRITALRVGYLTSSHQLAMLNFPIARLAEKQLGLFRVCFVLAFVAVNLAFICVTYEFGHLLFSV